MPGALVSNYVQQGKVQFTDPVPPEEARKHPGKILVYEVRTRVTDKKTSDASNDAQVVFYPVPAAIDSLAAYIGNGFISIGNTLVGAV